MGSEWLVGRRVANVPTYWIESIDLLYFMPVFTYYVLSFFHYLTSQVYMTLYFFILLVPVRKSWSQNSCMATLCSC